MSSVALAVVAMTGAHADVLRTGGTGAAAEMMNYIGAAFVARDPGTTFELIPSLGSSGGIAAVADGVLDVSVSSRPLKTAEAEKGVTATVLARTAFVLVSSHPNPDGVQSAELSKFYATPTSKWSDGQSVRVILRPRAESDTRILGEIFAGMASAIDEVRTRDDVPTAATDQDNLNTAEEIAGSLVATTFTQVLMEKRDLRFVAVDGIEPTIENFEQGAYPYGKEFHFVVRAKASPVVERFMAFLRSTDGQAVLRDTGNLPVRD